MEEIKIYAFADEASPDIDGQISAMKRNGLAGLEIRNVDGENVSSISTEKAREVRKKLDGNGLITWSVGSPIGKTEIEDTDFAAQLDRLAHTLEIAAVLGTENIRMFSFYMPKGKDPDLYKNEVIDRLGKMCELAASYKVRLCHENEKGIYGDTAARCHDILTAVPALKCIFDPANFVQVGEDTRKAWALLGSRTEYMHIKDALACGTVVPAGEGIGHLREIAAEHIANGGTAFTMEPHLTEFIGLANLERSGEESSIAAARYADADAAFDAACRAFKDIITSVTARRNGL